MKIEQREMFGGGLAVTAHTFYGRVVFAISREERAAFGDRLAKVIASRAMNAERSLRNQRIDAEWLVETVGADG
jgi:hypothetical protein